MKKIWRENGLSIVLFVLFAAFLAAQSYVGLLEENDERQAHRQPATAYVEYVRSGGFMESVMENWESEFLQMWVYVIFTVFLFQKGSSESKPLDDDDPVNRDPHRRESKHEAPWPVRKGGFALRLYEHSLSLAFFALFALSFALRAVGGPRATTKSARRTGSPH
jgi:hypothetical protein